MEIRFERGGGGVRRTPVVQILEWRRVKESPHGVTFRPGAATVPHRLLVLVLCGVLMGITHLVFAPLMAPPQSFLSDEERAQIEEAADRLAERVDLTEAERARLETRAEARAEVAEQALQRNESIREGMGVAYTALMVLFGVLGLLPVVSLAWNRVSIWKDASGRLMLHRWGVFPKTRALSSTALGGIRVVARQHVERRSFNQFSSVPKAAGWRWRVRLDSAAGGMAAEFVLHHQRERPREGGPLPEPVRQFVESLERLTGLRYMGPAVEEHPRVSRGARRRVPGEVVRTQRESYTTTIPLDDPAALDALPPDIRAQVAAALRGDGTSVGVDYQESQSITVRDASGNVHYYQSPEDMPPEVRALYDKARGEGGQSGQP